MKRIQYCLFAFLILSYLANAQKEVLPITMSEDSKFQISASAKSINDVTLTIKIMADDLDESIKEELGFKDKEEFKLDVKPFYESTFKQELKAFLTKVARYEQKGIWLTEIQQNKLNWDSAEDRNKLNLILTEGIKSKLQNELAPENFDTKITDTSVSIEEANKEEIMKWANEQLALRKNNGFFNELYITELIKYLGDNITATSNSNNTQYYKAKILIDESLDRLFQYFNNQIILLFKYDIEPVAGTLHYKTSVEGIQYFDNSTYETFYNNLSRKNHKLIKKLHLYTKGRNKEITQMIDSILKKKKTIELEITENVQRTVENKIDSVSKMTDEDFENLEYLDYERLYKYFPAVFKPKEDSRRKVIEGFLSKEVFASDTVIANARKLRLIAAEIENKKRNNRDLRQIDSVLSKKKYVMAEYVKYYFSKMGGQTHYLNQPSLFVDKYEKFIYGFRLSNRRKRMDRIYNNILENKNEETLDSIKIEVESWSKYDIIINKSRDTIKLLELSERNRELKNKINEIDSKLTKYADYLNIFYEIMQNVESTLTRDIISTQSIKEKTQQYLQNYDSELFWYLDVAQDIDSLYIQFANRGLSYLNKVEFIGYLNLKQVKSGSTSIIGGIKSLSNKLQEKKKQYLDGQKSIGQELQQVYMQKLNMTKDGYENYISNAFSEYFSPISEKVIDLNESIEWAKLQKQKSLIKIEGLIQSIPLWDFSADVLELDFNDGFVEHIISKGRISDISSKKLNDSTKNKIKELISTNNWQTNLNREIKFTNEFPYGFSSSKDYDDFKSYQLTVYNGKHREFQVRLDSLFPNYVQKLQNDRLDFSPKDQVVTLPVPGKEDGGSVELKKETSSKLFNLSLYTDFLGLRGDPNGIVQFEFNKPIPIYTKRQTSNFGERYLGRGFNFGYFNYINPQLRWSRLDATDDDRNLVLSYLDSFEGGVATHVPFVTTLDLLRYENVSVGGDLNILSLDFPTAKWRLEANMSFRYGRTRVLDTEGEEITGDDTSAIVDRDEINTWRYYPELIFRLRPEERYGANLSLRAIRFNTVTTDFSTVSSAASFEENLMDNQQWLHQLEINAHFSPSARRDDRFFFRYRYSNNANWETNGFSEIQVGYSMELKF